MQALVALLETFMAPLVWLMDWAPHRRVVSWNETCLSWTKGEKPRRRPAGVVWYVPNLTTLEVFEWTTDHLGIDLCAYTEDLNHHLSLSLRFSVLVPELWVVLQDPEDTLDDTARAAIFTALAQVDEVDSLVEEWAEDPDGLHEALVEPLGSLGVHLERVSIQGYRCVDSRIAVWGVEETESRSAGE